MFMTKEQFQNNEEMRSKLEAILADPILKYALDIVENEAKPRGIPEPRVNAHLDTLTTQRYCRLLGIQQAIDMLHALTKPPLAEAVEEGDDVDAQPFFHTLPEPMKNAIRQLRKEGKI